ncbi:hypothetical protein OSB04_013928 [Centaurea solstitialis]|uniref:Uncharacterized protein n=1 Tax=Centaurea solstitialis TaxID=347529 RepID=A0AA38TFY8_9ASTR|nr:hypothetical protein OSB04_013928 [Centaurea solstitialis]
MDMWVDESYYWYGDSDYKWSVNVIITTQLIGIVVGSIAPIFRCITAASYFNLSILWSINHINIFRVEKHWTQRLRHWKEIYVPSYIPGRQCKKVFNHVKNMILNFCMALQIMLVVICKTICLVPTCIMILFFSCCHFCNSLLKRLKMKQKASNNDVRSEIEEYICYVLQIEDDTKLTHRTLRNMLRAITKVLHKSEKKQPRNLMKFLEKSTGFNGVTKFDNNQVPPLFPEEIRSCWSLVVVTLTSISLALPNIEERHVNELLSSINEGLQFVRHIEETLNVNGELVKARKTTRRVWTEVEVYSTWLEIDLQNKARKRKSSKEILRWLGDEAVKIVLHFKSTKKVNADDSLHKIIAASSMYRISQTILLYEQENCPTDVELFEWISTVIADILCACFTNLPRVITLKCHHDAIEKRAESIRTAAQLLGKSKTILNILEERQLPGLDQESMAYIDKWQALQITDVGSSSTGIQPVCSSPNKTVTVSIRLLHVVAIDFVLIEQISCSETPSHPSWVPMGWRQLGFVVWHGKMKSTKEAMPWVGLYIALASLICTLAMTADVFQGFRQRKLWFPCRFFTLNAASITLIAVAMKLPVDLSDDPTNDDWIVKSISIVFLFTMLANFLPSLACMDDKELFTNIIALGILIITVIVNMCIQLAAMNDLRAYPLIEMFIMAFFPIWLFWVALTVPASRRVLEHQYQVLHKSDLNCQEIKFSSTELIHHVKRYWMMAETGNPQFVLACSSFCSASGMISSIFAAGSVTRLLNLWATNSFSWYRVSDYSQSINVILIVQLIGTVVGSIAPIFRSFTTASYFNLSILWSINHINMFRVEKHWTERLRYWKHIHVTSYIPGRQCKKVFNHVKNMILNICMALQITLVVICKTICFVPTCIMLAFYSCCHFCNSLLKRFKKDSNASNNNVRSEIEEYIGYVLQIEDEPKLTDRKLRNMLTSITKLLHKSEKKRSRNLMKLLEKSTGFSGIVDFDNDQVLPLFSEETLNCWSLATVTLTVVALSLPNTENGQVNGLLASMREGLKFVRHVEETLNANGELVKAIKTARHLWTEAEVYNNWLEIDLQNRARKGKSSDEILRWLGDEAVKIMIQFKRSKKRSVDDSLHKFIAASSMYKIRQSILLHCNEQEHWPTDVELFEWISTIIADLLWACFTNLPRVITLKCHHDAIEKRGESIRTAAQLLGKSKTILNILEGRQLPDIDHESMAYIDKWRALLKDQISNGRASSSGIQSYASSSNESVTVKFAFNVQLPI